MNECISSSKQMSDEQQLNQVEHDLKRYKYNIFSCLSYTNVAFDIGESILLLTSRFIRM